MSLLTAEVAGAAAAVSSPASTVSVRAVSHVYRGQTGALVHALDAIDLEVASGTLVAILGPSGCGKTTLLRIVSGLLEPSGGDVRLAGEPPRVARRRRAIGWLAQEDGLLPWRSVADNIGLAGRLAGRRDRAAEQDMLRRVGLTGSARQYPHELSGGMRQRVALGRALLARPPFVLLDEPFAHLDEITRERLGELLLELRAETAASGRLPTTLLVTHSASEAVRLADRVVVMAGRPGRVVLDRTLEPLGAHREDDGRLGPVGARGPRREDEPGFGATVRELKAALAA